MYLKAALLVAWLAASYALLVFCVGTWWLAVPLAVSLGLAMAGVGFNVMHDGGHRSFSGRQWVNKIMAMTPRPDGRQLVRLGPQAQLDPP